MLTGDPELDVIECGGGTEAVRILAAGSIDLVFLDIRMRDLDGFGVIQRVGAERMPVVVFTTAYSDHAIDAFEACALDYVLKPIGEDRLARSVTRAKHAVQQRRLGAVTTQLVALLARGGAVQAPPSTREEYRFAIRSGASTFYVAASAVDWIESADNYARLWTAGRSHLVRESLHRLAQVLQPEGFIRVHRTALVNVRRIRELRRGGLRQPTLVLQDGTRILVSRERRSGLEDALRAQPGG